MQVAHKLRIERYYNKRVRLVTFHEGDFVYKNNEASRNTKPRKLTPNWEGPYLVIKKFREGMYKLSTMDGKEVSRT